MFVSARPHDPESDRTHLSKVMRSICLGLINTDDDPFNLVTTSPLDVTWMLINATDVLADFRLD